MQFGFGQSDWCGFVPDPNAPEQVQMNCDTQFATKCVRINFHFINNTSDSEENVPDDFFLTLLERLNTAFEPHFIQFRLDDECVEHASCDTSINTYEEFDSLFRGNPPSQFNHKADFLNFYIIQNDFARSATSSKYVQVRRTQLQDLAHEVGHFFGLDHTFQKTSETVQTQYYLNVYECKDRNSLDHRGRKGCETRGDKICDTGADPWELDSLHLYRNVTAGCTQDPTLLPSFRDYCGDSTTAWDVPVTNYMSYYSNCYKEFTKCQRARMHDNLEGQHSNCVVDCQQSTGQQCADTIIDNDQTWSNGTLELCPGQKIIITSTGSLTLDSFKLTKKSSGNVNCPDFSGNWDGIHILGGFYGPGLPQGLGQQQNDTVRGALFVTNGSIIEYSNKGIQAKSGFGIIQIDESIMRKNGVAINSFSSLGGVHILNNSLVDASKGTQEKQISLVKCPGIISASQVVGPGTTKFTGLYSSFGKLNITTNSVIRNFNLLIEKERDRAISTYGEIGGSSGLRIENSNLLSTTTAIRNRSKSVYALHNMIEGAVNSDGICFGKWLKNNFKRNVDIINPQVDMTFSDNIFTSRFLRLTASNLKTNAVCNKWTGVSNNDTTAVDASRVSSIKNSWGTFQLSSGNRWIDNIKKMKSDTNQTIINYHFNSNDSTKFNYLAGFFGVGAISTNGNCLYDYRQFTNDTVSNYTENCNLSLIAQMWHQRDLLREEIEDALSEETQLPIIDSLNERLADVNYILSDLSSTVLRCLEGQSNQDSIPVWTSRLNPELNTHDTLNQLWTSGDFNEINNLGGVTSSHESDFQVLLSAADLLASYLEDSIDIYNLKNDKLLPLVDIANESYGDYTNELRAWLNTYYNIRIDAPLENAPRAAKTNKKNNRKSDENSFLLIPNPTNDCFRFVSTTTSSNEPVDLIIYDLQGREKLKTNLSINQNLCLRDELDPSIYIVKLSTFDKSKIKVFKLIIQ